MSDVFLSYSRQDAQVATIIRLVLIEAGLDVFFDRSHITFTAEWRKIIRNSLEHTRCVIVLVGKTHLGESQQAEVAMAIEICKKKGLPFGAVLLPGIDSSQTLDNDLAARQWFDCDREPITRLAEIVCARLGVTSNWGGTQFGPMTIIKAPTHRGDPEPILVDRLVNAVNERVVLTWQSFVRAIQRIRVQIEAAGRGWHPTLIGVNPTGFIIAASLQQDLFGGAPLGYYPDMAGHAAAWPPELTKQSETGKNPTILVVDSELKSGKSLANVIKDIRNRCAADGIKPKIRVAVLAAELTDIRAAALPIADRSDPDPCPSERLKAWKTLSGLDIEALYIGFVMDGPGTIRPLHLR